MRVIRIALLLCDELTPATVASHGDNFQMIEQFLTSSLALIAPESTELTFALEAFDVVKDMAYPPDDTDYDGLFISGSRASAYEDVEWINKLVVYVRRNIASKPSMKVFGFCFGHHIISKALGFWVKSGTWEVSVTTIQLTPIGKAVFQADELDLPMIHHDQVSTSLPGAQLLGSTVAALNQGFAVFEHGEAPLRGDVRSDTQHVPLTSIHVLALQANPEFTEPIMRTMIDELRKKSRWSKEFVEDALERVDIEIDAIDKVGRVIWGMLGVTAGS